MKRPILAIGAVLLFIFGVIAIVSHKPSVTQQEPIDVKALQAIVRDIPAFTSEGKPVIKIDSISQYAGKWYVATISSIHMSNTEVPVKIVLVDQGEPNHDLKIVLGPDVYFSESQMTAINLPDSVVLELQKS